MSNCRMMLFKLNIHLSLNNLNLNFIITVINVIIIIILKIIMSCDYKCPDLCDYSMIVNLPVISGPNVSSGQLIHQCDHFITKT